MRYLKNTTGSDLFHTNTGTPLPVGIYIEVDDQILYRYEDTQMWTWFSAGDVIYSDDGVVDISNVYEGFHKLMNHCYGIPFLSDQYRLNGFPDTIVDAQIAIEYAKTGAIDNDLDKMQFGRQGTVGNNSYLLTLNNLDSSDSPDVLGYDIFIRRVTVSISNLVNGSDDFTIRLYKTDFNHANSQVILEYKFGVAEGNFSGRSGNTRYTDLELDIPVDRDWGLYAQNYRYSGSKPSNMNLIVWTRKR